ncbi:MAG: MATE family efflux transporter [Ruminococcus sp.]|nr:MATE family efflux transporter [Ruminococcus sp.]
MKLLTKEKKAAVRQVMYLSIPAILAEISSIIMQYIDAAMVGHIGAHATAAIGLVSTTTWLIGGLCISSATGFSVQIAQLCGAKRYEDASGVFKQALKCCMVFGLLLMGAALAVSRPLPSLLRGDRALYDDASAYFFIFALALPFEQLRYVCGSALQCSGNMKTPSILNTLLCVLDVLFNTLFIFGLDMGVKGAALGTAASEVCISLLMFFFAAFKSDTLSFRIGGSGRLTGSCLKTALRIAIPSAFEHTIMCAAYVATTYIAAPLGTVSLAANSLAVTAESLCYMPGYGIGSAATTLVGQSIGAGDKAKAKSYANICVIMGMLIMAVSGIIMFFISPFVFTLLTSSAEVAALGTLVLRIEVFAEPLYGASIVCAGALRGAGDTLLPSIMSLISMWGVRITSSVFLVRIMGLKGMWIAMCGELCFRGIIFLIRLMRGKWLDIKLKI